MDFLLKAKNWQLFILMYGFIIVMQIAVIALAFFAKFPTFHNAHYEMETFLNMFYIIIVLSMMSMGVYFAWLYAVSMGLRKIFPTSVNYSLKTFKAFFIIPIVFYCALIFLISFIVSGSLEFFIEENPIIFIIVMLVIVVPMSIFSAVCMIYLNYFAAKSYKTALLQREVRFKDFVGEFFLIYFLPVGIWILQPKINKLFSRIIEN